jgi:hypothetical protein
MAFDNLHKTRELAEKDMKKKQKANPKSIFKIQRVTIGSNYLYAVLTD